MPLLASQVYAHIRHALGKPTSAEISAQDVANEAGHWLVSIHSWRFLERPSATLSTVGGQAFINLPSDFAELIAFQATDSLVNALHMTTLQYLLDLRTNGIAVGTGVHWGAITHSGTSGAPVARLELYPTPSTSQAGFFTIFYRSGWTAIANDNDSVNIPDYVRALYLDTVRAFAQGWEESDNATLSVRLEPLLGGSLFRAAARRDALIQSEYGPMTGGAVQSLTRKPNRWLKTSVQGPS